jgi:hypothetical protein
MNNDPAPDLTGFFRATTVECMHCEPSHPAVEVEWLDGTVIMPAPIARAVADKLYEACLRAEATDAAVRPLE